MLFLQTFFSKHKTFLYFRDINNVNRIPILRLTFKFHADVQTLLEAAEGATLPLRFVNVASPFSDARIDLFILNSPLEEALARLAGEEAIVVAANFVPADGTQFFYHILGVGLVAHGARRG